MKVSWISLSGVNRSTVPILVQISSDLCPISVIIASFLWLVPIAFDLYRFPLTNASIFWLVPISFDLRWFLLTRACFLWLVLLLWDSIPRPSDLRPHHLPAELFWTYVTWLLLFYSIFLVKSQSITTSQKNITTSQKNIPTSQKNIPTSQKNIPTSQKNITTSQKNITTSQKNITTSQKEWWISFVSTPTSLRFYDVLLSHIEKG